MIHFDQITTEHSSLGGKAQVLGLLSQRGFNVPKGIVLTELPKSDSEWEEIFQWWKNSGGPHLAIRSSASQEDSKDHSFAGQNETFLNVSDTEEIKEAVSKCFDSVNAVASKTYRRHFLGNAQQGGMNVILQEMVHASKSGVFFSLDPRATQQGWLLEVIDGLGEDLVSGKKTPHQFSQFGKNDFSYLTQAKIEEITAAGLKVRESLGHEVDMEFSLDSGNHLYILQARPITTLNNESDEESVIEQEITRLKNEHDPDTVWDGHTFSEWSGNPGYLTFSLWQKAFSPHLSFGDALEKLGYLSFRENTFSPKDSILESVFGHAYINLNKLAPLFFGPIPYRIKTSPRTHLKFDFKSINLITILRTPYSLYKMLKVGWELSTSRKKWIRNCHQELTQFKDKMNRPLINDLYHDWEMKDVFDRFAKEHDNFTKHALLWPFILIILVESSLSSLNAILTSIFDEKQSQNMLKRWLSIGIHTASAEMNRYYKKACTYPEKRAFFMARYGHRGAGELDLSKPRWIELGSKAFFSMSENDYEKYKKNEDNKADTVEAEISELKSFKRSIVAQEWDLLRQMIELRESWKMELLRPYAHIRFLALEIGKRFHLEEDIFWLNKEEILSLQTVKALDELQMKIAKRKAEAKAFKKISLPDILTLEELDSVVHNKFMDQQKSVSLKGEPLSPGITQGFVQIIEDFAQVDLEKLDPNTIIFAHATDPGWTPIFTKVKGIIVEKGGVLSHCSILAREMNIPAISGIEIRHGHLKNGSKIWLDGTHGTIGLIS